MLRIAVDFDGTLVENEYPDIGKPKLFAFETLKALQEKGFRLILWTVRSGKELDDAVLGLLVSQCHWYHERCRQRFVL